MLPAACGIRLFLSTGQRLAVWNLPTAQFGHCGAFAVGAFFFLACAGARSVPSLLMDISGWFRFWLLSALRAILKRHMQPIHCGKR